MLHSFIRSIIRNIRSNLFIILLTCFAFTGCAIHAQMYPGESLEAGKQAIIRGDKKTGYFSIDIFKVDSKIASLLGADEVTVLPGKHTIRATVHYPFSYAFGDFWLVAEPGGRYILRESSEGNGIMMWIEDEKTGKPVGGIMGSDDEPK